MRHIRNLNEKKLNISHFYLQLVHRTCCVGASFPGGGGGGVVEGSCKLICYMSNLVISGNISVQAREKENTNFLYYHSVSLQKIYFSQFLY